MKLSYQFQSRTRPWVTHTVKQDSTGQWFCDCEASMHDKQCWHIEKVMADKFMEDFYRAKEVNKTSISFQQIINDAWEYIDQVNMRRHW